MDDKRYFRICFAEVSSAKGTRNICQSINEMDIAPSAEVEVIPKLYIAVVGNIGLHISVTKAGKCAVGKP